MNPAPAEAERNIKIVMVKEANNLDNFLTFIELNTKNPEDIREIYNIGIEDIEKLSFEAKYLNGLQIVLLKNNVQDSLKENCRTEFQAKLKEFIQSLQTISGLMRNPYRQYFDSKFLTQDSKSLQNILTLIKDLSNCKNYLNDLKNKSN
jgi:hypothetical protein